MKLVPLSKGKFAMVDDEDYEMVMQLCWYWTSYNVHRTGYAAHGVAIKGKRIGLIYMHDMILRVPIGNEVDHRDGDGLNNQRYNLRAATRAQQIQNSRPRRGTQSGYKGVWKNRDKWTACIHVDKQRITLGQFDCPIDAAKAYNIAALKYFGEFARLNEVTI